MGPLGGEASLRKRSQRGLLSLVPCEDTVRRRPPVRMASNQLFTGSPVDFSQGDHANNLLKIPCSSTNEAALTCLQGPPRPAPARCPSLRSVIPCTILCAPVTLDFSLFLKGRASFCHRAFACAIPVFLPWLS